MNELIVHPSADPPAATTVRLGRGVLGTLGLAAGGARRVLVVSDDALPRSLEAGAVAALEAAGASVRVDRLRAAEAEKTPGTCERLWNGWVDEGAGRDSLVVALGGGLVSDVAGFSAACFHRGVPWIVVPTTTLSMADAALGGKTAVNLAGGKNLAGAVHHPLAVIADVAALDSLPRSAFADGFAEVIKAALVGDAELLDAVEAAAPRLRAGDADAAGPLLWRALVVKAGVVEADARETSRREILNFGHTVGHALEHATGHRVSHGRAVAAGIVAEARLAERLGRLPPGTAERAARACESVGVSSRVDGLPPRAEIVAAMRRDKKVRAGVVRAALPAALGSHSDSPGVAVDAGELADLLGG